MGEAGRAPWEEGWWTLTADLGELVAPLIGANEGEVVFQPNVTLAHAVIYSAFDFAGTRAKIVTDAMHFPSILYLIDQERRQGARVAVIPSEDGISVDTDRLIEAIDEQTAIVSLSHILFKSAFVHDIAAIAAKARAVCALTVIDGYQAVGTIPVDVRETGGRRLHRRLLEMALRWTRCGIRLGGSAGAEALEPEAHRLDGPSNAVRISPNWCAVTTPGDCSTVRPISRHYTRRSPAWR